jgi:tetratricopeptide (TPR) repeat protein
MKHYDHDTLSRFGLDPSLVDDPETLAAHLDTCQSCGGYFAVVKELDQALRDTDTWAQIDHLLAPSERRRQAFALRDAMEAEEADARRRLEPLLHSPLRFNAADVAANPKLRTPGAVRVLCAEAKKRHETRPLFSIDIANAAFAIARALGKDPGSRRRFSLALSLRERANALRYLGRFTEALEALGYAEKFFDETPAADPHDVAIVQLIRATVYMKSERLPEAIAETERCLPVFRDYGDQSRELSALMVQGASLYLSGSNADAVRVYEQVIASARQAQDVDILRA